MTEAECRTSTITRDGVHLHTFTSPDLGEGVNNHVMETPNALVVVDVPLYRPYAEALLAFLHGRGKPVERILLSHAHPDHWLSLGHFPGIPSYAYPEVMAEMEVLRDLALGYHRSIHPDLVPTAVAMPAHRIEPGPLVVDGVQLVLHKFLDAEATATMAVEIPAIRTLIAQDLVYAGTHRYLANKDAHGHHTVSNWIRHLEGLKGGDFELILPGHGAAGGPELFDENIEYLRFAEGVLATAKDGDELHARLTERFPGRRLDLMLTMTAVMLYPPKA
jgi:glyoxylase-like metal-dependent hydrolase (beta-lactamase superfamily II)